MRRAYVQIPHQHIWLAGLGNVVIFTLLGLILLTACDPPGINNNGNNNGVGNGNKGNCNGVNNCNTTNNTSNTGGSPQTPATRTTLMPTIVPPTVTPTQAPYAIAKSGDVCKPPYSQFQASGWAPEQNGFVFSGNGSNVVIAPCTITTPNYSVTATIRLLKAGSTIPGAGVVAHADSGAQNGYAGGSGCRNISFGKCGFFINDHFGDIMDIDVENENLTGLTHSYRLVVNGINLQLFYDNSSIPIVNKSLATDLQAGYAGFECYDQCEVTGFAVTGV